jgi:hypothetical protein
VKAALRFNTSRVVIDLLLPGQHGVFRYVGLRTPRQSPADAIGALIDRLNEEWERRRVGRFSAPGFGQDRDGIVTQAEAFGEQRHDLTADRRLRRFGFDPRKGFPNLIALKRAYRRLAKECHPDVGGSHESMLRLNKTYEQLKAIVESGGGSVAKRRVSRFAYWAYHCKTGRWSPPN